MTPIEKKLTEEILEIITNDSTDYDTIRINTLKILSKNKYRGISERCRIIFNPIRHILIHRPHDRGIYRYFDVEVLDDTLDNKLAETYLKTFVLTLIEYCNNNPTYLKSLESRIF